MNDFMTYLSSIPEPRVKRCRRHELIDILFLSISAVLCGAEGWEEMEYFGHARLTWLKRFSPLKMAFPNMIRLPEH